MRSGAGPVGRAGFAGVVPCRGGAMRMVLLCLGVGLVVWVVQSQSGLHPTFWLLCLGVGLVVRVVQSQSGLHPTF